MAMCIFTAAKNAFLLLATVQQLLLLLSTTMMAEANVGVIVRSSPSFPLPLGIFKTFPASASASAWPHSHPALSRLLRGVHYILNLFSLIEAEQNNYI